MRIPRTVCAGVPLPPIPGGEDRPANNIRWPLLSPSPDPFRFYCGIVFSLGHFLASLALRFSTLQQPMNFQYVPALQSISPSQDVPPDSPSHRHRLPLYAPLKLQTIHHGCLSIIPIIVPACMQNLTPFPIPPARRRSSLASKIPTLRIHPTPSHQHTRHQKVWTFVSARTKQVPTSPYLPLFPVVPASHHLSATRRNRGPDAETGVAI